MIAACKKFSLSIYEFHPEADESAALQPLPSYVLPEHDRHAHVVLSLGDCNKTVRGHFSRLFTAAEWTEHRQNFAEDALGFSDTSLSGSDASQDSSTSESSDSDEAPARPSESDKSATEEPKPLEDDKEDDLDSLSDVSDNSDLFNVCAKQTAQARTLEDEDLEIIDGIVPHLREYPLLPPDSSTADLQSFTDLQSGQRLPMLHCGFKGCDWYLHKDKFIYHLDMEGLMYEHLSKRHRQKEMASVPEDEWDDDLAIELAWEKEDRIVPRRMHALVRVILMGPSNVKEMMSSCGFT